MKNTTLNKLEKYWILYDVGNSAFVLLTPEIRTLVAGVFIKIVYEI